MPASRVAASRSSPARCARSRSAARTAKEIKSLISASVERVEHGTALVDRAGVTMTEVVAAVAVGKAAPKSVAPARKPVAAPRRVVAAAAPALAAAGADEWESF